MVAIHCRGRVILLGLVQRDEEQVGLDLGQIEHARAELGLLIAGPIAHKGGPSVFPRTAARVFRIWLV